MFAEVTSGVLSALEIYEKRASILQIVKKSIRFLLDGNTQICVFGVGGTGKSTLGSFLMGSLDTDQSVRKYGESLKNERFTVKGEHPASLIAAPGQRARRPGNWDELYRDITSGKTLRIENVVSWGLHASGIEHSKHKVYRPGATSEAFRNAYIKDSKEEEIAALDELSTHLMAAPGRLRMLTLITKQDLWWNNRDAVQNYYNKGEYSELIDKIRKHRGEASFAHDFVSCALIEQNLTMADGFLISQTAAGYDDALRVTNLDRAAHALNQLIEQ